LKDADIITSTRIGDFRCQGIRQLVRYDGHRAVAVWMLDEWMESEAESSLVPV